MNRSMVLLFALLCCVCGCQTNHAHSDNDTDESAADIERTVDGLVQQHCQALVKKDWAALDRLWADDFTFINYRGELVTKAQRLENLRSGATSFKSIDITELSSRALDDDAAVSTCRAVLQGQYSGQEGSGDYRTTFVWSRENGGWKLKALQMTRVEK